MGAGSLSLAVVLCLLALVSLLAALGCLRLATPLARLHAVSFLNVLGGAALVLAALLTDGWGSRSLKCLALALTLMLAGALLTHVTGRALLMREARHR
ncbi:MAG TPA: monovalent cation/H(+) antiporter subunit G [Steroidobacteraceae bacterium]|nr:monovalent cation/H(+) antiporter subunit G [Steroidobacteraceae bacterium]